MYVQQLENEIFMLVVAINSMCGNSLKSFVNAICCALISMLNNTSFYPLILLIFFRFSHFPTDFYVSYIEEVCTIIYQT